MSFCRIYTENSFFWVSNDSTNSKKLKKKPIPIPRDPRTGRPMIKPKVQVDDKDFGKLFHDIVFQFTCDCDSKYEHKGLPLGNENSFQVIQIIYNIFIKLIRNNVINAGAQ